jgi:hypothetical protein
MSGACRTRGGDMRKAYKILIGKLERNRQLGRLRHRWEDNIRMDLRKVERKSEDWIHLAQNRDQWWALAKTVMNLRIP